MTSLRDVNFGMFASGERTEVFGHRWNIKVIEDKKGSKSFRVISHDVESWFSFSKYGLKQAIRFIKEKADGT